MSHKRVNWKIVNKAYTGSCYAERPTPDSFAQGCLSLGGDREGEGGGQCCVVTKYFYFVTLLK